MLENKLDATLCLCVLKKKDFQLWKKGALYFNPKTETLHDRKKIEKEIRDSFNNSTNEYFYQSFKENWRENIGSIPHLWKDIENSSHLIFREGFDNSGNEIIIFWILSR